MLEWQLYCLSAFDRHLGRLDDLVHAYIDIERHQPLNGLLILERADHVGDWVGAFGQEALHWNGRRLPALAELDSALGHVHAGLESEDFQVLEAAGQIPASFEHSDSVLVMQNQRRGILYLRECLRAQLIHLGEDRLGAAQIPERPERVVTAE